MSDERKQYDNFAHDFSQSQIDENHVSREIMYEFIGSDLSNKKVLDLACGDGMDALHYQQLGGDVVGIDASVELINIAKQKYQNIEFTSCLAEDLPYENSSFDCIFTKYAIMTSADMKPIFDEVYRVLKPGGIFIYLVVHPFRQFIERKKDGEDYFNQTTVSSVLFGGRVTVQEPTHTMNDYFNADFFSKYEMIDYKEVFDPAAEQINGGKYPGFLIVKAMKK